MRVIQYGLAILAGAAVLAGGGMLMYGVLLPTFLTDFLETGSSFPLERTRYDLWIMLAGMLAYAGLLTVIVVVSRPRSVVTGAWLAALVSVLLWTTADWLLISIANVGSVRGVVFDPFIKAIPAAFAGAIIFLIVQRPRWYGSRPYEAAGKHA